MNVSPSAQRCEAGHNYHASRLVEISLGGQPAVPDFPPIPHEYACRWPMHVWDTDRYMGQTGIYCTGQDETSLSIASQGIWEGYETLTALEILQTPGLVVDIGAQVGWYTMLAAYNGCPVVAVEADPENVRLLQANSAGLDVSVVHGWVGEQTAPWVDGPRIRLLKADIEGLEREAVRVIRPLLETQRVDWLLLELTPSFPGSNIPWIIETLNGYGYQTWLVPEKGTDVGDSAIGAAIPVGPDDALTGQRTLLAGR